MKKFKKVLSILLCLVLMAGILPVSALADGEDVAQIGEAKFSSLSAAIDAAQPGDTVTLLTNTQESISITKAITLDLNEKTLTGNGGSVITINAPSMNVSIFNGTITGGSASSGGGITISCGTVEIANCTISKNTATTSSGGGIYMHTTTQSDSSCRLVNCKITDNTAKAGGGIAAGAANYQNHGREATFYLKNTSIIGNHSTGTYPTWGGGGVYLVGNGSRFTMESGEISNNDSASNGGGIFSRNWHGITIEGGEIKDNTATAAGGGIYIENVNPSSNPAEKEVLSIASGVVISGNHAGTNGGGIALNNKDVTAILPAGCELYNNTADTAGDDVYAKCFDGYQHRLTLPKTEEMSGDLILKQDNQPITGWYYDGLKNNVKTPRWSEVTAEQPDGYFDIYTPDEADASFLALKAAHEKVEEENPASIIGALPILWLNMEDHYSYIVGYPDGTVQPNGKITRAEVATIFFRLLSDDTREAFWSSTNSYSDVTADKWYNNAVSTLSRLGVISGYPDGTFRPDASITRAEFAKIAVSFCKYGSTTYSGCFSDVKASDWFSTCVETARNSNLIAGYPDGTFRPNNAITRAEACTIVNRTLGRKPAKNHMAISGRINWPDCLDTEWFYADMMEATNSHDYQMVGLVEDWNRKLPQRDWAALETEWSHAYSAPGGEVGR